MLKIVMRNRKLLMRELHTYYTQKGIANYAVRIGQIFCILVTLQVS